MDIRQLKYFLAVAEEGQITSAAKKLNISQPPLSQQLKALENELGVKLFIRNSRNVELTEAGIILRNKSEQILELVNATEKELKDLNRGLQGTLNIGTVGSSAITILPEKIHKFHKKYPNINFQMWDGSSVRIMELLNNGIIELGFVRAPFNSKLYNSLYIKNNELKNYTHDTMVTVAKSELYDDIYKDTISIKELENKPLIIHRRFENIITEACNKLGFNPKIICKNDDIISSLTWANAGIGIALVPRTSSTLMYNTNLKIKEITNPSIEAKSALIWMKNRYLSTAASHFIEYFNTDN
ncbi:MAG: LysR family transcriptional regulator [Clostridium sp.]|uniref:LysR family transcriptional regulator n=1 Tax=Clostridium sp. TaxID=1506 RepID=UPI0039E7AA61